MKILRVNRHRPNRLRLHHTFTRLGLEPLEERRLLTVYSVTSTTDSGAGSLRDAITQANANPGADTIDFAIPGSGVHTITALTQLPAIIDSININGESQPGYAGTPLIELDGSHAGNANGLQIVVGDNTISGLDIHSFGYDGIVIAENDTEGNNIIEGNYIGTDPTGTIAEGNQAGIHLLFSPDNIISGNLISGNRQSGIFLADKFCAGNLIQGNLIGTDVTGLVALGNQVNGVALGAVAGDTTDGFASGNTVGGTTAAERNVISGNGESGVWIAGGNNNTVEGNYIGVGMDGTTPLGNGTQDASADPDYSTDGVFINGGSDNLIGGIVDGAGNVISANVGDGVRIDALPNLLMSASGNRVEGNLIGTDKSGNAATDLGNANGVEIRNDTSGTSASVFQNLVGAADSYDGQTDGVVKGANVISNNRGTGVLIAGPVDLTTIIGNDIGVDKTGNTAEPNAGFGVSVVPLDNDPAGAQSVIIGNESAGAANDITANGSNGINIEGATNVSIESNFLYKNTGAGVAIYSSSDVQIGGTEVVDSTGISYGNVISNNAQDGIDIGAASSNVTIVSNEIGTDKDGTVRLKNGGDGVSIENSSSVTIGEATPAAGNIISGNAGQGILIDGQSSTGDYVLGNDIGVGADGKTQIGNGINGVVIQNAGSNFIGGPEDGDGNIISDNTNAGILIQGSAAVSNAVYGNWIGVDANGNVTPNAVGVEVANLASSNYIGNGTDAAKNVIGGNTSAGIYLTGNSSFTVVSDDQIGCIIVPDAPAIPAPNQGYGVEIVDSSNNIIGNFGTAQGNFIESTAADPGRQLLGIGVLISGAGSTGNQLQYNNIGANASDGIEVTAGASGNVIGGIVGNGENIIDSNGSFGISINGQANDNQVLANDIGTDNTGIELSRLGNGSYGIDLYFTSQNTIQDNSIENNKYGGVFLDSADMTSLFGNYVIANAGDGIIVTSDSTSNVIGALNTDDPNVIDANQGNGVAIDSNSAGNQVVGNDIGADSNGDYQEDLGNTMQGVLISDAVNNTIQGNTIRSSANGVLIQNSDSSANSVIGNTIANNTGDGVQIAVGAYENTVGGTIPQDRNWLSQNGTAGVELLSLSHTNTIAGNWIGTDENGQYVDGDGNDLAGIGIDNSSNNTIQSNVVRGNAVGIGIIDNASNNKLLSNIITNNTTGITIKSGATNNAIGDADPADANLIGTDDDGQFNAADGNIGDGVDIKNASSNTVQDNEIRGNANGVLIENADTQGNVVSGNDITNNVADGVQITNGATMNTVGGAGAADGNLISLNANVGVEILNLSNNNKVIGNWIGTDDDGQYNSADGNFLAGIGIDGSNSNTIHGNTIRGNAVGVGLIVNATGNTLTANTITNSGSFGVNIKNSSNNAIGGPNDGDGNTISLNGSAGVAVVSGTGNAILRNNISGNDGLGIDLGNDGVTPNDDQSDLDADTGPNNLQNFPVLTAATTGGSQIIAGSISSAANTTYTLQFFNLDQPDASGYGQGDRYLADTIVTTNASGVATFNVTLPGNVVAGSFISATATDPTGNTSEFSQAVLVQQDTDGDGIGDLTEDNATNGGDANNDGIPDSQEPNVASFQSAVSGQYITLASPAGTTLSNVTALTNPSPNDAPDAAFDQGFFSFTVSGVAPGGAVDVQEILPAGSAPLNYEYFRYGPIPGDPTPQWYYWDYYGQTGAEINANVVTLHFIDGQVGDDDQTANGTIVDSGGPAFQVHFDVTNTNDSGPGSLRQAILNSNSHPGNDLINFNIPGVGVHTIVPLSTLPTISDSVIIDGTTQPGYAGKPLIEIDGAHAPGSGLQVTATNTTIEGLVINRFSGYGIYTYGYNVDIEGNYLGTDATGTHAMGNLVGIFIDGGYGVIGGTTPASANVVSGNTLVGIIVNSTDSLAIEGNLIGTAADGVSPLGNAQDGIRFYAYATNTTVGGLDPGDGNVIAFNGGSGIGNYNYDNAYLSNSIYSNAYRGIDNEANSALNDSGATDGTKSPQNYPVLISALSSAGQTTISGFLNSAPDQTFLLQFFSNPTPSPSGYGQGKTYLGSTTVTTDDNGHVDFTAALSVAVANGQLITSTATGPGNDTSMFSMRIAAGDVLGNVYIVNSTDDTDDGAYNPAHVTLRDAIFAADAHPGLDTIDFDIPGGGVQTISPLVPLPPILDSVVIDGTTQPGYAGTPLVQISGNKTEQNDVSGSPLLLTGLYLAANDSTVKGLDINGFYKPSNALALGGFPLQVYGDDNVVEGCFIGTDPTGTLAMPDGYGVYVSGTGNRIGGTTPAERNIISGNDVNGLTVTGPYRIYGDTGAPNIVEGNFIGTDVTGTKALGNGIGVAFNCYAVSMSGDNILGGSAPGAGNVISGNSGMAVTLTTAEGSIVQGDFIGTDVTGTKMLGNGGGFGINLDDEDFGATSGVTIGGTQPGEGNLISDNAVGVYIYGSLNVIQGNKIGTDIGGTLDFGNGSAGIVIAEGNSNLIGGPAPGTGNLVSGNYSYGIALEGFTGSTSQNDIQGNLIGTQADGVSPLGNGRDGIVAAANVLDSDYSGTGPIGALIGGTNPGDANTIAFNGGNGVNVIAGQSISILSNSIFSNGALGIDLNGNGVTANDTGDTDTGSNGLQNFPVLATVVSDGIRTTVTGSFNSAPNTFYQLQFFSNPATDPSGFGQGRTLLGTRYLTTDGSGNATFLFNFPTAVSPGQVITSTATDPQGNTSEFSADLQLLSGTVAPNQAPTANAGGPYTINEGDSLTLDATHSADPDGDPLTYSWDINGDGVFGDATGANPTLSWAQLNALGIVNGPSSFSPQVRLDDGQGHVVTSSATTLKVLNVAPTADAGPDQYANEEDTVSLTGTFTDPGTADTHTLAWHVDADNGQAIADGSGPNFSFVPDDNGTYTVTFTVTDSDGAIGTAVVHVFVADVPPVLTLLNVPAQGTVGTPINISVLVTDVSPVDTAAGFQYGWQAFNEDNDNDYFNTFSPDFSFTPTDPGTYDIYLYVSDKDGGYGYAQVSVVVTNNNGGGTAPTVTLPAGPTINEGDTYTASGSFVDPDVGDSWTATVNYGDGSGDQTLALNADNTFDLSHLYADNGGFDVVVTVTDSTGLIGTQSTQVTVNNVAPAVTLGNPSPVAVDQVFTLAGSFADPGADTWIGSVNFGDGTGDLPLTLAANKTFTLSHTYQSAGSFSAVVTVTDDDGGSGTATFTEAVGKVQTSLSAASASATYGGKTTLSATLLAAGNPATGKTLVFSINGHQVGSATTDGNGTATLPNVSIGSLHVGSASISVAFAADDVDVAATGTATLSVTPATLVITANSTSKLYGAALPALTASYAGFVNSDTSASLSTQPTLSTTATASSHVNTYPITASGAVDADYTINYQAGTLSVTPAALTITASSTSKVYGAALPALTASYAGFVNSDSAANLTKQPTLSTSATSASHVAGSSYPITASGAVDADYTIGYQSGTLTVTPAALTITASSTSKVYGAALPTLTASYAGFVNSDSSASLTTQPQLSTTATAASSVAGSPYAITVGSASSGDYTITYVNGALTVTPATLTITADSKSKAYGAVLPTLTVSYAGFVNSDTSANLTVQPNLATTATSASHVSSYPITVSGAAVANYSITYVAGALTVTPVSLTITAANGSKVYGAALPTLTAGYAGFVNGDSAASLTKQPTLSTTATAASHVAGNPYPITASGAIDADYTIGYQSGALSVTPATLTITANSTPKVYGAALPALTASYAGFVNNDAAGNLTTQPILATTATAASPVASYPISVNGAADPDYTISYAAGSMSVTPAALTITADNKTKVAGAANPTLTFTPTGFVNGDTASSLSTQPVLTTTATTSSPVGPYPITASGAADPNYTISYVAGTLTVTGATGGSITGKEYLDVTGNGLTADDMPLAGAKVYLDTNNNGSWNTGEPFTTTLADGSYALTGLAAGNYKVREVVPTGYVRTGPATTDYYSVTLTSGQTASGDNFDNAPLGNTSILSNVVFLINGTTPVSNLSGTTHEGDTIEVSFTVAAGTQPQRFTLVSYTAPGSTFNANTAAQQAIFDTDTGVFGPGSYTLTVSNPHSYFQVDFVTGAAIDHLGPSGSNIFYTSQTRLLSADNGGTHAVRTSPASLTGTVYLDANNNGTMDGGERPISGVTVTATCGSTTQSVVTDTYGVYTFDNLAAGTYTITETQPSAYSDGKDTLGNKGGMASNDKFSGINLTAGTAATGYNFGEQQTVGSAVTGTQTQTAAWWNGSSGQALLKALNGSQNSKTLGNWLATDFSNLFGANAGSTNNLSGKTNAQVATYYQSLYSNAARKPETDALALALNVYVTNSSLAGNAAVNYGFAVSSTGLGSATANVGPNGAAFGINDNTMMTIAELLSRANAIARKGLLWDANGDGTLNPAETILRNQAYSLFDAINNS